MRTTLMLDDDVYESARSLARGSGEPLGKVISQLIRRALQPQGAQTTIRDETGLPSFEVSPAAELIPSDRAAELLAAEGEDLTCSST